MKMVLTTAKTPDEYFALLTGWQARRARALRDVVKRADPGLEEILKWGHAVYSDGMPLFLIRAEPTRVLFTFWRGKQLRHIEPRLKPGGKYEMATLTLGEDTPLDDVTVEALVTAAVQLSRGGAG